MKMQISDTSFLATISLFVVTAVIATAYIFLVREDYDFVIEAPCDPAEEICFYRDCSAEECPPNGLENYRVFSVSAKDFPKCSDNSCLPECTDGVIACTETVCSESDGDVCAEIMQQLEQ